MSKRDSFKKTILKLSRCKSIKNAMRGWGVKRLVLADRLSAVCELCGTKFKRGVVIARATAGRPVTITVGGDCLEAILCGRFADRKFVANRKKQVAARLLHVYKVWLILGRGSLGSLPMFSPFSAISAVSAFSPGADLFHGPGRGV